MVSKSSEMAEDGLEDQCPSDEEGGYYIGRVFIPPPPPNIKKFKTKGHPRLIIHSIEMNNFKSYTGTEILGPFCKSFNAIIGPNGSGKSNVIDAMLFVFGTKSSQIRGTNNHSVIHYSKEAGSADDCFVTVQFVEIIDKDSHSYDIVPNSEIRITRRAFRYKTISFYFINEQPVRFKDIEKLLRQHGVDLTYNQFFILQSQLLKRHGVDLTYNRFLILQGQVEQISQLPPKGRNPKEQGLLEYFEEIIGTNRYNTPFNLLRQEIENNEMAKESYLAKVNAAKELVESLAADVAKCLDYFKKENAVMILQHQISQAHLAGLQRQARVSSQRREEKESQAVELRTRVLEVFAAIDSKQAELGEIDASLSGFRQSVQEKEDALAVNLAQIAKYEASNKEVARKSEKYKQEQKSLETKEKESKNVVPRNTKAIKALEETILDLDATVKAEERRLEEMVGTIADATKDLKEKKDRLQQEQMELSKQFDKAKSEYQLNESKLSVFTSTEVEHTGKLAKLRLSLEEAKAQHRQFEERRVHLQSSIPSLEAEIQTTSAQLQRTNEREAEIDEDLRKYQTEAAELSDRVQKSTSRSQLIDFVMNLKSSGAVSGILGRLGDLGAIDERYDVAVSTSCGSGLDHIVCETVEAGQAVLAHVKRANVGRVFVMALDQMHQYRRYTGPVKSAPGNLPRLFDLIRVEDERVKTAMYYATHNTLVATSLERAMQVGYAHNVRVVTLEGAIIEPSGIMSGGGRTLIRGKMGRSVQVTTYPGTAAQRNKIMRKIENLRADLSNLQSTKINLVKTLNELNVKIGQERRELQRLSIDIPSLEHQIPAVEHQIRELENGLQEVKLDPKMVKKLTDDVRKKKLVMNRCGEEAKKLEDKVLAVHEEIMEVSSNKTRAIKKCLSDAQRKLNKAKSDLNNLRVDIKRAARDSSTFGERFANLMEEMQTLALKKVNNDEHIGIYREQNAGLRLEIEEKKAEVQKISVQSASIMQEMARLTAWHDKEVATLESVDRELKTIRRTHEEYVMGVKHAEERLAELELKPLPVIYNLEEVFAQDSFKLQPDLEEEFVTLSAEDLERVDITALEAQISKIDNELKFMDFNEACIAEYKTEVLNYGKKAHVMKSILATLSMYSAGYEQCVARRQKEFDSNFVRISRRVQECYQMLTFGGKAELEYKEYSDPYAQGIKYVVRPLRKTWKNIECLSGGEKTLASLALVFAVHYYAPSPLYFLDEIDAALDVRNVAIIGHFIRTRTRFAQFIIISLRDEMFELASNLIGIWKINNCTHTVTVNESICQKAKEVEEHNDEFDIEDSEQEEEEEEEEEAEDTGTVETEETIATPAGPGTGVPASGGETEPEESDMELDEAVTEPDEKLNEADSDEDDDDGREEKDSVRRRARKRKDVDSQEWSDAHARPYGKRSQEATVSQRLRVRGVQQINEDEVMSQKQSALQEFIQRQSDSGVRRLKQRRKGNDTADGSEDETANEDNGSDNTADETPTRARRGRPRKTFVPNTEDENSEHSDLASQASSNEKASGDEADSIYLNETLRMDDKINVDKAPKKRGRPKKGDALAKRQEKKKGNTMSGDEMSQDEDEEERTAKQTGRKTNERFDYNTEEDDANMSQAEDTKPIRRRGRKPKRKPDVEDDVQSQDEDQSQAEEDVQERKPKRKRGRKPKAILGNNEDDNDALSQAEDELSQDELSQAEEDVQESKPRRKRGRKPKAILGNNEDDNDALSQAEDELSQDELSQAEEDVQESKPRRKRGRKPKARIDNTEDNEVLSQAEDELSQDELSQAEEDVQESKPRRKRGRKPKARIDNTEDNEVLSQAEEDLSQDEDQSQAEDDLSQPEDDAQESKPKRKRGRKPKARIDHTEDNNVPSQAEDDFSQGEEELSQAEEENQDSKPKRKKGRKPKARLDYNTEHDEPLTQAEEDTKEREPKKRRGRKPKSRTDDNDDAASQDEDLEEAPKKAKRRKAQKKSTQVESDADAEMSQEEDADESWDRRRDRGKYVKSPVF